MMNKEIIKYFKSNIKNSFVFLFLIMIFGAFFEIVGIGLFIPLLNNNEGSEFIIQITDFFSFLSIEYTSLNIVIMIIFIFIFKFFILNLQNYFIYKYSYNFMYNVKKNLLISIYSMNFIEFNSLGVDTLNNIFTKEIEKSSLAIRYFLQVGVNLIYALFYSIFAIYINYLIVIVAIFVGLLVIFLQKYITKAIIKYSKTIVDGNTKTNLVISQILNNMKYIMSTDKYMYNNEKFDKVSFYYSKNLERMSYLNSIPKHTPEFIGVMLICVIIIINEFTIKENIITIVFLSLLLYRTLIKILSVQKSYQDFLINIGSIENIIEVKKTIDCNKEKNHLLSNFEEFKLDNYKLQNVYFEINKKSLLKNINLEFKKGQIYSIIGKSGAGKSTLLNIISSLISPTSGNLLIDKKIVNTINYKNFVGLVSQEIVIFEGTIKENILFGEKYNSEKYNELVKSLSIDSINVDYIKMGGTNISGGQRQLIAFAREIYKEPSLLILDEFTSALDSSTEKKVLKFLDTIKKTKIVIIVAHRLSSILESDVIYFMQKGEIIEQGNFNELYKSCPEFMSMCNNQNIFLEEHNIND